MPRFEIYKKGQGTLARWIALGGILLTVLYGCHSFYWKLHGWTGGSSHTTWFDLPVIGVPINLALVLALVLFLGLSAAFIALFNRPRIVDLLIETETEFRKITWPSWPEAFNSAMVVIGTSLLLAMLLFVFDLGLHQAFGRLFARG
jgi:preprotein translocase SecE subunit